MADRNTTVRKHPRQTKGGRTSVKRHQRTITKDEYQKAFDSKSNRSRKMDESRSSSKIIPGNQETFEINSRLSVKKLTSKYDWEGIDTQSRRSNPRDDAVENSLDRMAKESKLDSRDEKFIFSEYKDVDSRLNELHSNNEEMLEMLTRYRKDNIPSSMVEDELKFLKRETDKLNKTKAKMLNLINSNQPKLLSYREQSKGKMGPYMASEGGHTPAIQKISKEWNEYQIKTLSSVKVVDDHLFRLKSMKFYEKKREAANNIDLDEVLVKHYNRYYIYTDK